MKDQKGTVRKAGKLTATLKAGAAAVVGATITFYVDGVSVGTGTTSSTGVATITPLYTPDHAGVHVLRADFAGDATHAASTATAKLTVAKAKTKLVVVNLTSAPGGSVTLKATLTSGAGVGGATLKFTVNGSTYTAVTDGSGVATVGITAPAVVGVYPIAVSFTGNADFLATSKSGNLTVK